MIEAMKFWVTECDLGWVSLRYGLTWSSLDFWKVARTELDALKHLFWLGETEKYIITKCSMHLTHGSFCIPWKNSGDMRRTSMAWIMCYIQYDATFSQIGHPYFFTSNHDENSHSGSEYERIGDAAKPFAVLCATWNGIPLIYNGQELPMTNKRLQFFDKDLIPWTGENAIA